LSTSEVFGPVEKRRWEATIAMVGSKTNAAELCYQSAYGEFRHGTAAMAVAEKEQLLTEVGGHQALARVAVAWCNVSLKKLDILPFKHPEFAKVEKDVRVTGFRDDVAFLSACQTAVCKDGAAASIANATVGVGLEAER
jgi:hypothetical protein